MNPTVKTGLTFVAGGVCGAVGSRIMSLRNDRPKIGPDGRPILGPDGRPIFGPDGRPVLGPDGRPIFGPDGRPTRPPCPREAMAKKNAATQSSSPTETAAVTPAK